MSTPTVPVKETRAGKIYNETLQVPATGDTIAFTVFEPTQMVAGDSYPLVLNGPGYGGSRTETAPKGSFIARLRDAGYYVLTMDPRGFGQSSGTVRVMDPDYYGRDMVAVLDWAENLPGLRRRANGQMLVGSFGGSYGGMFQLLLAGADPQHRLRVVAPDITPHDLNYALDENNVVKSGWGLALVAGGEANNLPTQGIQDLIGGNPATLGSELQTLLGHVVQGVPLRQDTTIYEILVGAGLTNEFNPTATNFMEYHSVNYFCAGKQPGPQQFLLPTSVPDSFQVPPTAYPKIDALLTQGMQDTLFNYNNGYANYQCLKKEGGDVRLLSHQGGHILPLSIASIPTGKGGNLQQALDPFYAALNIPEFQGPGGAESCGSISVEDADFAWFQQYLQGIAGAADKVITTGTNFCMSLADKDAIELKTIPHGGQSFDIKDSTPQLNSLLGIVGSLLGTDVRDKLLSVQPFYTAPPEGAIVAGIPTMKVSMASVTPLSQLGCKLPNILLVQGCDPILYLAIGVLPKGSQDWQPVDAQYTPIRGFGEHDGDMNGISIRLKPGDQLGLLVYAFTAQYPITWSRDVMDPAVKLSGSVQVPFVDPSDIVRQGV
ncbi:MAG TPA: alpha/beta fold hydrolase [Nevskiaceae bacterium]|nr:alpha/beta fold hydrolase [Nevskiaceae bacterium]